MQNIGVRGEFDMKKCLLLILVSVLLLISTKVSANANYDEVFPSVANKEEVNITFNIENRKQTQTVCDEKGVPITFTLTHMLSDENVLSDGDYLIQSNSFNISMSFKITISSNKITKVYDGDASILLFKIQNESLKPLSLTRAEYSICGRGLLGQQIHTMSVSISSGKLVIKMT